MKVTGSFWVTWRRLVSMYNLWRQIRSHCTGDCKAEWSRNTRKIDRCPQSVSGHLESCLGLIKILNYLDLTVLSGSEIVGWTDFLHIMDQSSKIKSSARNVDVCHANVLIINDIIVIDTHGREMTCECPGRNSQCQADKKLDQLVGRHDDWVTRMVVWV